MPQKDPEVRKVYNHSYYTQRKNKDRDKRPGQMDDQSWSTWLQTGDGA
jgi:hypothetical protein